MIVSIITAVLRATLVAIAISIPSLLLVPASEDGSYIVLLGAFLIGGLVCLEYLNTYPCLLEFREAPPFNRIRFGHAFCVILGTSLLLRGPLGETPSPLLENISVILGHTLDFEYSPVHLVVLMLPQNLPAVFVDAMRLAAGFGFFVSLLVIAGFYTILRVTKWPLPHGSFNVWTNLPLLDPTTGGDIVDRLTRDGRINIALGIVLPFLFPAVILILSLVFGPEFFSDFQSLAWMLIIWSIIPTTCAMRGMAMLRISALIQNKRQAKDPNHTLQIA